jgi:hypothetical protein
MSGIWQQQGTVRAAGAATGLVRGPPLRSGSWFASVTSGGLRGFSLRL